MEGHYILPRFFLFLERRLSKERNSAKFCHMFGNQSINQSIVDLYSAYTQSL